MVAAHFGPSPLRTQVRNECKFVKSYPGNVPKVFRELILKYIYIYTYKGKNSHRTQNVTLSFNVKGQGHSVNGVLNGKYEPKLHYQINMAKFYARYFI